MFEKRGTRSLFRPKRTEVTGGWRKLRDDGLNYVYALPYIVTVIKSRWMRWAGHMACMGKKKNTYRAFVGKS